MARTKKITTAEKMLKLEEEILAKTEELKEMKQELKTLKELKEQEDLKKLYDTIISAGLTPDQAIQSAHVFKRANRRLKCTDKYWRNIVEWRKPPYYF